MTITTVYTKNLTDPVLEPLGVEDVKIEVVTVPDCPHRVPTLDRLREALACTGDADVAIIEREVGDAAAASALGMRGSPTILLDGRDLFADEALEPSLSCRLYRSDGAVDGTPSVLALIDALKKMRR